MSSDNINTPVDHVNTIISFGAEQEKRDNERVIKRPSADPFTRIRNSCLQDENLSDRATALIAYIMSLPSDWVIHTSSLCKRFNRSRPIIQEAVRELCEAGYMRRYQVRSSCGTFAEWVTEASDIPIFLKKRENTPETSLPETRKPLTGKIYTTKETLVQINTYTNKQPPPTPPLPEIPDAVVGGLLNDLTNIGFDLASAQELMTNFAHDHIEANLHRMRSRDVSVRFPVSFLKKALVMPWGAPPPKPSSLQPTTAPTPRNAAAKIELSHQQRLCWFNGLSDADKRKAWDVARNSLTILDYPDNQVDILSSEFLTHSAFTMMMHTLEDVRYSRLPCV